MATIIRFPAEVSVWRETMRQALRTDPGKLGEILMFTGVRYARHEGNGNENGNKSRPKRKRRAKA